MKTSDIVATSLLIVGGLNWGLVGAANFDLVTAAFGPTSALSRLVYILVGLAAVYQIARWKALYSRPAYTDRERAVFDRS